VTHQRTVPQRLIASRLPHAAIWHATYFKLAAGAISNGRADFQSVILVWDQRCDRIRISGAPLMVSKLFFYFGPGHPFAVVIKGTIPDISSHFGLLGVPTFAPPLRSFDRPTQKGRAKFPRQGDTDRPSAVATAGENRCSASRCNRLGAGRRDRGQFRCYDKLQCTTASCEVNSWRQKSSFRTGPGDPIFSAG